MAEEILKFEDEEDEKSEEELENIIDETPEVSNFRPAIALEEILPTLTERGESSGQGIRSIRITGEEENEDQQSVYDSSSNKKTGTTAGPEAEKNAYETATGVYDNASQESFTAQGPSMTPGSNSLSQDSFRQESSMTGMDQTKSYQFEKEKELQEDRRRRRF